MIDDWEEQYKVGRVGISLTTLKDWEVAFDGLDLAKVVTS